MRESGHNAELNAPSSTPDAPGVEAREQPKAKKTSAMPSARNQDAVSFTSSTSPSGGAVDAAPLEANTPILQAKPRERRTLVALARRQRSGLKCPQSLFSRKSGPISDP